MDGNTGWPGGSDGGFLVFPHIRRNFLDLGQKTNQVTTPFPDIKKSFSHVTKPFFG
jgi:hypothetical protein